MNNEELKSYIVDGVAKFNESIECDFDICIDANIEAYNIKARNIEAHNIEARNIEASNIKAYNIEAWDIKAYNIKAWDINASDIEASNINAWNIDAFNIKAWDIDASDIEAINIKVHNIDADSISYHAYCISYHSLTCSNIKGSRKNSIHKCLDSEIDIKEKEINFQGKTFKLSLQELNNLKEQLK